MTDHLCQACHSSKVDVEIPTAAEPDAEHYRLCVACADRLESFALRPGEWFNLTVIHGPFTYHLHDDF